MNLLPQQFPPPCPSLVGMTRPPPAIVPGTGGAIRQFTGLAAPRPRLGHGERPAADVERTHARPQEPRLLLPRADPNAASLLSRLTPVTASAGMGLRRAALAYAPSATPHRGFFHPPSHDFAQRSSSTANSSLVRNAGRCHGSMPARSLARM